MPPIGLPERAGDSVGTKERPGCQPTVGLALEATSSQGRSGLPWPRLLPEMCLLLVSKSTQQSATSTSARHPLTALETKFSRKEEVAGDLTRASPRDFTEEGLRS